MRWLLASLALGALYWSVAASAPPAVGLWQDDAVYLATARSLAEGSGYRHPELPGEPLQTKYPPLFPALLAAVWRLAPDPSENLPWLLAPGAFAAGAFVVLSGWTLRRVLGASRGWALAAAGLAALSPEILSLVRFAMSDLPYALLAVAACACLDGAAPRDASRRRLVTGALLVAAAVYTRSLGLTLALAAPAALLLRRRRAGAALVLGVVALAVLPWWLWQAWAAAANGPAQDSPFTGYDLSYGLWLPGSAGELLRVAWQNLLRACFGLGFFQLALPAGWALGALRSAGSATVALHALCYAASGLALAGFVSNARRAPRTLHVYAALYAAALLVWPFEPYRFLICWTPFLLYFELEGLRALGRALRLPPPWADAPALLAAALLLPAFAVEDARILASDPADYSLLRGQRDLRDRDERAAWLRRHARPGGVVASNDTGDLYLASGLQLRSTTPGVDPVALFYGPDRRFRELYALPSASETQALFDAALPHLDELFRAPEVAFYVERTGERTAAPMRRYLSRHPGRFYPVLTTANGHYRVYEVTPPAPAAADRPGAGASGLPSSSRREASRPIATSR